MSNETLTLRQTDDVVPAQAAHWQSLWLGIGVVGVVVCIVGAVMSLDQFMRGYLIAFVFWLGLSLGCLALLMVQYLSGGFWGLCIRSVLEAASKTLPLMAVLFLPILFLRGHLYAWMNDASLLGRNGWYLHFGGLGGWLARAILYFAIWIGFAYVLNRRGDRLYAPLSGVYPRFQGLCWSGLRAVLADRLVRGSGLGDVARPALGLDHLRPDLHRGTRLVGAGFLRGHADHADPLQPVQGNHQANAVS